MIVLLDKQQALSLYDSNLKKDFGDAIPPFSIYQKNIEKGIYKVYSYQQEEQSQAYMIIQEEANYILMLFFAVMEQKRGQGIGTKAIEEVKKGLTNGKILLIEVENKQSKQEEELGLIKKRIQFYKKLGFEKVEGLKYSLKGKSYDIMFLGEDRITAFQAKKILEWIYHKATSTSQWLQIEII